MHRQEQLIVCMNYINFHQLNEMRIKDRFPNGLFSIQMYWERTFWDGLEIEQFIIWENKFNLCLPKESMKKCHNKALP